MEIIIKEKKDVEFGTLSTGQTFIDNEYDADTVFMVVKPTIDVKIETFRDDNAEYFGYAVDLSKGRVYGYGSAEQVTPVSTTLTAERD